DPPEMAKLLKWMVHSLEVFCWDNDDYFSKDDSVLDWLKSLDLCDEAETEDDIINSENITDESEVTWSVWLKYSDGHEQSVLSHEKGLPEKVLELYWRLAEYYSYEEEDEDEFDFMEQAYACQNLLELKNLLVSLLSNAAESGNDALVALTFMDLVVAADNNLKSANEGNRIYHIHSGSAANVGYLLSFIIQAESHDTLNTQTGKDRLRRFTQYVGENIVPPIGASISVSEIDTTIDAIDKKYKLFSRLFKEKKLTILRMNCTHKEYNSICNAVKLPSDIPKFQYELYLFHGKNVDSGHPVYIFLHELGHILQTEVTRSPEQVPESFLKFTEKIIGKPLVQGNFAPEFFADAFAMAMMQTFDWAEYDPFEEIAQEVKNAFRVYMDWLIEKLFEAS
ncbi:MAG: hypothetical protein RR259_11360, partial [Odoribacter sp.]